MTLTDSPPEQEDERVEEPAEGVATQVWGNLGAFLDRLDEEWNSSLKVLAMNGVGVWDVGCWRRGTGCREQWCW